MKKMLIILTGVLMIAACNSKKQQSPSDGNQTEYEEKNENSGNTIIENRSIKPEYNGRPFYNSVGNYREVFNDSNYLQYEAAERIGIEPIEGLANLYQMKRPLVKIESCEFYKVDSLTHSMPYLVPEAAGLLKEIGKDFADSLRMRNAHPANRIIVTSLLRTRDTVQKLRRVNKNAVDSSTHMFATTFDISWSHFDCPDSIEVVNSEILKGILAEVLLAKRNEGKCYVKYESKSPCFHITAR